MRDDHPSNANAPLQPTPRGARTFADETSDEAVEEPPAHERFEVHERIGEGGMGAVYRAFDHRLGLPVALKSLRQPGPAAIARLKGEFRVRARLQHAALLMHYDLVVDAADAFITMELVDGCDLPQALRAGRIPDGRGLLAVLRQVTEGLGALHDAGLVHRDVKPENILIAGSGRSLLADFGLATSFAEGGARDLAGTPRYLAPEVLAGDAPYPPADLYALGVTVLDALRLLRPGAPDECLDGLRALARRLTAEDPARRPDARALLSLLDGLSPAAEAPRPSHLDLRARAVDAPFVGRAAELTALRDALSSRRATPVVVHIHGPSGIGKSGLVQRLLGECARAPDLVVLAGQCHPSEHLDYRGIDGVVEALAQHLPALGGRVAEGLSALQRYAVTRHFPSLRRVPGLPLDAPLLVAGTRELRHVAWEALKQLLGRVCEGRRVLLWIDDLQWADDDALDLLAELQGGDDAPPAVYLLSYRLDDDATRRRLSALRAAAPSSRPEQREVALEPMSEAETGALLGALLPALAVEPGRLAALSREVGGYPVFARVAALDPGIAVGGGGGVGERLAHAFNRAVAALPPEEREGLDAFSLAERPVPIEVALATIAGPAPQRALAALERAGLVTRLGDEADERYQPTHDRLRRARLEAVTADERRALHRRLARSFEQRAPGDLEALALHWSSCGEVRAAGGYALRAADRAAEQLAFGVAARHYTDALRWLPPGEAGGGVRRRLADALANHGHGRRAAQEYERCVPEATATATATELRQRAAEQYFHCGEVDEGYRLLREALRHHGVRLPGSRWECLATSLALRLRLLRRGTRFAPRPAAEVGPDDRQLLDTLWTGATSLAHVNHALGDVFHLRYLLRALEVGEPRRVLRSLTYEAAAEQTMGGRLAEAHSGRLLAQAEALVAAEGDEYDRGWYWVSRSSVQTFRGDWPGVVDCARRAEEHLERHGIGVTWERAVNNGYWLTALALRGDVAPFAERHRVALADARSRHDALAEGNCCSGYGSMLWLYRDQAALVREHRRSSPGAGRWTGERPSAPGAPWPGNLVSTPDYHEVYAAAQLALYEGDGAAAYATVAQAWEHMERALLLRVQFVGADLRYLLGRAAVAAVGQRPSGRGGRWSRAPGDGALLARAAGVQRELAGDHSAVARAYAASLGAQIGAARGRRRESVIGFAAAAAAFDGCSMAAHAEACRWRAAELGGDAAGHAAARSALGALGMVDPGRVVGLLAPAARGA
jgi:hypothetical protein